VLDAVFSVLDKNGDGSISYEEFLAGVNNEHFAKDLYMIFVKGGTTARTATVLQSAKLSLSATARLSKYGPVRTTHVYYPQDVIYLVRARTTFIDVLHCLSIVADIIDNLSIGDSLTRSLLSSSFLFLNPWYRR